jgi:hypothetical protein
MTPARCLLAVGFAVVALLPCAGQEGKSPLRYKELLYPIGTGYRWHYRVLDKSQEEAKKQDDTKKLPIVQVTVEREQVFNLKIKNDRDGGTTNVVGFELQVHNSADKKTLQEQVLIAEDGVYRISGAGKVISPPLRILKKDARKGDAWTVESQSENAEIRGAFVATEETVVVPAGKFPTVAIRTQDFKVGAQDLTVTAWYAPDVGMVKQHVKIGSHDVILELEKFEKGK